MKILTRIAAATVAAITMELMAESAANSFATATGEGVKTSGDAGFVVVNAQGPVPIALTARPGWRFNEGGTKQVTLRKPQVLTVPIFGRDGEERETLVISNVAEHVHSATNYSKHISAGALKATVNEHLLKIYPEPEKGAILGVAGSYEVIRDRVHEEVTEKLPCPVDTCPWGRDANRLTSTNVHLRPLPVEVRQTVGGRQEQELYPRGTYQYTYSVTYSNECEQCCCGAKDDGVADVYRAEMVTEPWIGLDRTDEGRKQEVVKVATVAVPGFGGTITYDWTPSEHCEEVRGGHTASFSYRPKDHDTPSDYYRGELHDCEVAIADAHGCSDAAQVTNRFTIVKLDVQIGEDDNEKTEETEGYNLYEVPDRGGEWTEEGTNALVQVTITCDPHDSKMLSERVTVEVRDELLYECKTVNGKKEYTRAKASYTVRELLKTEFFLHGHSRSDKYLGDAIKVSHPTSGAVDLAKFTIFGRPWLVPDYDRKKGIDDKDLAKAKQGQVFRFWINDDDDDGDVCSAKRYTSDASGAGKNFAANHVCGRRDLIDYTPVKIDISEVFPADTPDSIVKGLTWKLMSPCVRVVYSAVSGKECRKFQTEDLPGCGPGLDANANMAQTVDLDGADGVEVPEKFAIKLFADAEGVVYAEGDAEGNGLEIRGTFNDGRRKLTVGRLDIKVSSVKNMYRWVSIRGGKKTMSGDEPSNWPDQDCDELNYVFVHGFNVNPEEARASGDDLFKRLWQSGLKSMFTVINWDGDFGQIDTHSEKYGTVSLHYYENARRAFLRAPLLNEICQELPGNKVIVAHSLGNMVASSAIVDWRLSYHKYFMMDAAVAVEAYNQTAYSAEMGDPAWVHAPPAYRAARWGNLFSAEDFRHTLLWRGRFSGIANVVNCYSETEDVVGNPILDTNLLNQSVWYIQERMKGSVWLHGLDIVPFCGINCEGGWGFNTYYMLNPIYCTNNVLTAKTWDLSVENVKRRPLFTPFRENRFAMHSRKPYIISSAEKAYNLRARFLSDAIPAESFAAGANKISQGGIEDHDMMGDACNVDKWPQARKKDWLVGYSTDSRTGERLPIMQAKEVWQHSDFKQVAYFFNYSLFDFIIERR